MEWTATESRKNLSRSEVEGLWDKGPNTHAPERIFDTWTWKPKETELRGFLDVHISSWKWFISIAMFV